MSATFYGLVDLSPVSCLSLCSFLHCLVKKDESEKRDEPQHATRCRLLLEITGKERPSPLEDGTFIQRLGLSPHLSVLAICCPPDHKSNLFLFPTGRTGEMCGEDVLEPSQGGREKYCIPSRKVQDIINRFAGKDSWVGKYNDHILNA